MRLSSLGGLSVISMMSLVGAVLPARAETSLSLQSQPGDYIGGGQMLTYTAPADTFSVSASGKAINVTVTGTGQQDSYSIQLLPPSGSTLQNGLYEGA